MDAELLELQRQFEFAQTAKSSVRLSERNVVELVQKLQELGILDVDLLHTASGKEYITPAQLKLEISKEIEQRGRVSLIDLVDITGVDLYHVEKQAAQLIADAADSSAIVLIQGEIISQAYWDNVAEEINERLQECSQISISEISGQLNLGSELVSSMLEKRLGTIAHGRLEGGQLYTPVYVSRVSAMVRGAVRGVTVPMNLSSLWANLQQLLLEMNGAGGVIVENSFLQSLFNSLIKEGEILGTLRAGVHWTPSVFAIAQKDCIDSIFSQNSFVSHDALQKLGISQPTIFLQSRYPAGMNLSTAFVHPSLIEMADSAVDDAIERDSWIDCLSVLPSSFVPQDASKILLSCPCFQISLKANKCVLYGDSYVFSTAFVKGIYDKLEKELEGFTFNEGEYETSHADSDRTTDSTKPSGDRKKKKGKSSAKTGETFLNEDDSIPSKSKRKQGKHKDPQAAQVPAAKSASKTEATKLKHDSFGNLSEEWIAHKIVALFPDFEDQDFDHVVRSLANQMRPNLIHYLNEKRKALFAQNSEKMKVLFESMQKKLDEPLLNMQLFEKALDLFEEDQATSVILHRHLLRTIGASIVDILFLNLDMHNKLKNGSEIEDANDASTLSTAERTNLAKSFPGSLSRKGLILAESVDGKRVEAFMIALNEVAEESGLAYRKLDKKSERAILHSYRKDLLSQVSAESDPVALLPKVVSLLYVQVYSRALQAPGRAISVAISKLREKMDESSFKILSEYQAATVALLSLQAAAVGDEDDCSSDRILSKREVLETKMTTLKGLVLKDTQ